MGSTISGPPSVLHKMKSFGPKSKFSNKRFPRSHGENYVLSSNIVQQRYSLVGIHIVKLYYHSGSVDKLYSNQTV